MLLTTEQTGQVGREGDPQGGSARVTAATGRVCGRRQREAGERTAVNANRASKQTREPIHPCISRGHPATAIHGFPNNRASGRTTRCRCAAHAPDHRKRSALAAAIIGQTIHRCSRGPVVLFELMGPLDDLPEWRDIAHMTAWTECPQSTESQIPEERERSGSGRSEPACARRPPRWTFQDGSAPRTCTIGCTHSAHCGSCTAGS